MPTVSVVMPAYNAGKYIGLAFDSLIAQTFQDWECVVVNDGSTDNTLAIIQEYASREPRIRFSSIVNSGSAKIPRDTAISMARSEWIVALDADDTLAPATLARMLDRQRETSADVVLLTLIMTDSDGIPKKNERIPKSDFDYQQIISGKQAAQLTIKNWTINGNGLIAKHLHNSKQVIKNYMNADEYDTRQLFIAAKSVAFVDTPYYYREHESITRSFSVKLFDTIHTNKLLETLIVQTFGDNSDTAIEIKEQRLNDLVERRILLIRNKTKLTSTQYKEIKQLIKINFKQIPNRHKIYKANKIKRLLIALNYGVFTCTTLLIAKFRTSR